MPVTSPKVDKLPEPRGPHAAWAHCCPVLAGSGHAAPPNCFLFWGGSSETIRPTTATSNSNGISSAVRMKAVLILCQLSQGLQKQAHSFSFYFLASQDLCGCSLLLGEQLCCAKDTSQDRGENISRNQTEKWQVWATTEGRSSTQCPSSRGSKTMHSSCMGTHSPVLSSESISSQARTFKPRGGNIFQNSLCLSTIYI